ncbi:MULTISPECIES: chloride channel protein [Thermococcus]|uniref:Chloride channel protein EriC n=1 Tax=Thermococcus nautili TaxID=195522 RepID=W8P3B2_9EURY|nr:MULTISPECIES: chloride channel protein [Thermococcus]AHL21910.1 Chloride channel protein EriC [Thermococcus nautili]NJE48848.1 CBS domain-containing protein [Thermococcus sp. 9N3]CAI1494051.1 Chloride channel protein EriC [Thermococcus nautili]
MNGEWDLGKYVRKWSILLGIAAIAGLVGGLGALAFRLLIEAIHSLFFTSMLPRISYEFHGVNLGYILLPVFGALLIAPMVKKYPELRGNGVPEVIEGIIFKSGKIGARLAFLKTLATAISIGSGAPLGREGPAAFIGAALDSALAEKLPKPQARKLITTCGLAAGIAGTFNTPLAGAMFALEVIYMGAITINLVPIFVSAIIGNAITLVVLHNPARFPVLNPNISVLAGIPFYFLLGVVLGLIGYAYTRALYMATDAFDRFSKKYPFELRLLIGALGIGLIGMLLPRDGIFGIGFGGIKDALLGKFALETLIILALAKMTATLLAISSGFSGGIFAPSLFIGTMLGSAFGTIVSHFVPANVEAYALAGMAGFFAAATQAPLTQIIMITEMSGTYAYSPAVALTSVVAFLTARAFFKGSSIYTIKLERKGIKVKTGRPLILETIAVHEIMSTRVVRINAKRPLMEVERIIASTGHDFLPVVDDEGRVIGIIGVPDILGKSTSIKKLPVERFMRRNFAVVTPRETAQDALEKILMNDQNLLPVVDENGKLLGVVTKKDIYRAYYHAIEGIYLW